MLNTSTKNFMFCLLSIIFLIFYDDVKCTAETNLNLKNIRKNNTSITTSNKDSSNVAGQQLHVIQGAVPSEKKTVESKNSNHSLDLPVNSTDTNAEVPPEMHAVGAGPPKINSGALMRGFYVFLGLSAAVVIYLAVRAVLLRRKKTTVRKYGILANREDVEMTPLGAEDDEEDTTLFDVSNQTRP